jgi:PAS domain S-box-containing protein
MTGLRTRLEPHARVFLDLILGTFLALLWATDEVTLWLHLAYIVIALGAFLRPRGRSTAIRAGVVSIVGVAALLRLHAHGAVPTDDLLEIPLMTVLALLFAAFGGQRARAEQELMREKRRLAKQIDRIPLATVAFDLNARVVTWNSSAEQLFGWTADEVIGQLNPIVPVGEQAHSDELFARIKNGERLDGIEVTRHARDGSALELCVYSAPLSRTRAVVLYDDIRERKQAERERDHAESRYRSLIESLPVVTYIDRVDDHASNVYTSPQVVDMLGWPRSEWASDPHLFVKLIHPDDTERVVGEVIHANETREPFDSEYRLRHREGHYVWVHDQSAVMDDDGEAFARGFLRDITEQKKLEEQLRQAQKMDALGQFAGGIAHDFNNLLTGIGGYAELAASTTERGTVVARCLDGIKTAADEAASLTSRLLAFSRRNVPERRLVDLNAIVREAASLLERARSLGRAGDARARASAAGRRSRSRAAEAGRAQPRIERARRDAGRRNPHDRDDHSRRVRDPARPRRRDRHGRCDEVARAGAVLHHEARRRGNRPRPLACLRGGRRARRAAVDRIGDRPGHDRRDRAARGGRAPRRARRHRR